jgi:hypothetical protein
MCGACFGRISGSCLSKRASADSNLTSSMPSTVDSACRGGNERGTCVDVHLSLATTTADRVALVGMHDWTDPRLPAIAEEWGLSVFSPDALGPPARHCSTASATPADEGGHPL